MQSDPIKWFKNVRTNSIQPSKSNYIQVKNVQTFNTSLLHEASPKPVDYLAVGTHVQRAAKSFRLAFSPLCILSSASSGWQKGTLITKTHTTFYRPQSQSTGAVKCKGNKTRYSESSEDWRSCWYC
jgi:hypothetical protein